MELNFNFNLDLFTAEELESIKKEAQIEAQKEIEALKAQEAAIIKQRAREELLKFYKEQQIAHFKAESESRIKAEVQRLVQAEKAKATNIPTTKAPTVTSSISKIDKILDNLGIAPEDKEEIEKRLTGDEEYDEIKEKAAQYYEEKYAGEEEFIIKGNRTIDYTDFSKSF